MTTVEVTAADIAEGQIRSCVLCPLALALGRALGGRWFVTADEAVQLYAPRRPVVLPAAARRFVRRFDGGEPVEPVAFELDADAA